jgi:hypothetical protein
METITAYKCSSFFCSKIYANKKQAKAHEKKCYRNPETKSCATCQNFSYDGEKQTCFQGIPFDGKKLKTGCEKYVVHEDYII